MSEINATDHKTNTALPDEGFRRVVKPSVKWLSPREIISWLSPNDRMFMVSRRTVYLIEKMQD